MDCPVARVEGIAKFLYARRRALESWGLSTVPDSGRNGKRGGGTGQ